MQSFDPRSIILISFLIASLQSVILFALYRSLPREIPGLRTGVLSACSWALGAGLIMARGTIPDVISIFVGNMALSGAALLLFCALRAFSTGVSPRALWPSLAAFAYACALWAAFASKSYHALLLTITSANAIIDYCAAVMTWKARPRSFATRFLTIMLGAASLVAAGRFFTLSAGFEAPSQLYDPLSLQRLYLGLVAFTVIAILLAYTLMIYERVRAMLLTANASLESEVGARTADLTLEIERKQRLEREVASVAEAERRRIGIELHDDLGQRLTGISLVAEAMNAQLSQRDPALAGHADAIQRAASDAIAQVRGLSHGLMPVGPGADDFGAAMAQLVRSSSIAGVTCEFDQDEPVEIRNQDVATNLFRIAQEAINNAIRHGGATRVALRLERASGKAQLSISDNGCGFEWPRVGTAAAQGRGLGIIEFRASVINFLLHVQSAPGSGSTIRVIEC